MRLAPTGQAAWTIGPEDWNVQESQQVLEWQAEAVVKTQRANVLGLLEKHCKAPVPTTFGRQSRRHGTWISYPCGSMRPRRRRPLTSSVQPSGHSRDARWIETPSKRTTIPGASFMYRILSFALVIAFLFASALAPRGRPRSPNRRPIARTSRWRRSSRRPRPRRFSTAWVSIGRASASAALATPIIPI